MSQREPEPERGLFIFGGCFGKRPTCAFHCDDHLPYLWNCRDVGPTHDALVGSVVVLPYIRSVPGPEQTEAMPSRRQELNHRRRFDLDRPVEIEPIVADDDDVNVGPEDVACKNILSIFFTVW